jgi:transcriptional regulator with XRE-family HTH domain
MSITVDDPGVGIARRIRLERDARNWSLADLATRSGVSKATISKIERGEASPTAVVLVRVANAFDLTFAGLLLRAEGEGQRLSRAVDQSVWRDPATGYLRKQVFSRPDNPLEIAQRSRCPPPLTRISGRRFWYRQEPWSSKRAESAIRSLRATVWGWDRPPR